jgi:hypothetical protein
MTWLAEDDVVKLKVINDGPMIDFFIMLNKKIIETEKQIKKAKSNGRK